MEAIEGLPIFEGDPLLITDKYLFSKLWEQYLYVLTLSEDDRSTLTYYTDKGYSLYNSLASKSLESNELDVIFLNAPPLREPLTVYRQIREEFQSTINTYISTSLDPYVPIGFVDIRNKTKNNYFRIVVPAGTRVLPVAPLSVREDEYEVILPRNLKEQKNSLVLTAIQTMQLRYGYYRDKFKEIKVNDAIYVPSVPVIIPEMRMEELVEKDVLRVVESIIKLYIGLLRTLSKERKQEIRELAPVEKMLIKEKRLEEILSYLDNYDISQGAIDELYAKYVEDPYQTALLYLPNLR